MRIEPGYVYCHGRAWAFVIDIDIFIIASFANIDIVKIVSIAAQAYCLREDEEP